MTTENLHEFITLSETKSFTDAAESLYISVSSLSRHIIGMEKELGTSLFHRHSRSVELSDAGKLLLPHARQIVELETAYSDALTQEQQLARIPLNIGYSPDAGVAISDKFFADFVNKNRHFSLNLISDDPENLKDLILKGECDLAFIYDDGSAKDPELDYQDFVLDELVAVLPIDHPLASFNRVSVKALKYELFLLNPSDCYSNKLATRICENLEFSPRVAMTSSKSLFLGRMVAAGLGIAMVMKSAILPAANYSILQLEENSLSRLIVISRLKSPSFGAQLYLRFLNSMTKDKE